MLKNVAVDLDGVLAEQVVPVIPLLPAEFRGLSRENVTHWALPLGSTTIKDVIENALCDEQFVSLMEPIPGAIEGIRKLGSSFLITIATGRHRMAIPWSVAWLDRLEIPYTTVIRTSTGNKVLPKMDLLIDDYLGNIEAFLRRGPRKRKAVLLAQPWNSDVSDVADLLQDGSLEVADSWSEVPPIVRRLLKN